MDVPPLTSAYVIMMLLGGINRPHGAEAILAAAENPRSYPALSSMGPMMEPIAEAAAVPEPEIAPKSMLATTFVCAREPGILPVKRLAKLIRRSAIPPRFIIFPAKIKNGMASKLKTDIPEKMRWALVSTVGPRFITGKMPQQEEIASETAIGAPAISNRAKTIIIIRPESTAILMIYFPPFQHFVFLPAFRGYRPYHSIAFL